jgi:hypothetical protein
MARLVAYISYLYIMLLPRIQVTIRETTLVSSTLTTVPTSVLVYNRVSVFFSLWFYILAQ